MKNKVIVIVGPTASGKTNLGIQIAKKYQLDIINGDSVQVYQCLDIGSAKVTIDEAKNVKHHLLDIRLPSEKYSVYDFQHDARELFCKNDVSLIVGGTGLYIKAALYDYEFKSEESPYIDESKYYDIPTDELYRMLIALDANINIDAKNRRRVIRALELAKSNDPRSKKNNKDKLLYDSLVIYLDLSKEELNDRLIKRLDKQLANGFIDEVKALRDKGIYINAIGYKEINQFLDNEISFADMKALIILRSRQLAKRQKTFFKNQMNIKTLNATSDNLFYDACSLIDEFLG